MAAVGLPRETASSRSTAGAPLHRQAICIQLQSIRSNRRRCRAGRLDASHEQPQLQVGVPPPGGTSLAGTSSPLQPPPAALQPGGGSASWFSMAVLAGASVMALGAGLYVFVMHLRPVLKAAERAAEAAEEAAKQMEIAAKEMEKTARVMGEDMPITFQDMQRTSKEFEILGKQLNYLTGVVVKPVREPVQWVGRAAETTSSTVQNVTTTSIQRVVDDIKTLANSLTPTINQVRKQLAGLYPSGDGARLKEAAPAAAAAGPLSRAAAVAAQAEAAAREVTVGRRQAEAQRWIANWRSRSRGNLKAVAAAAAAGKAEQQQEGEMAVSERLAQVGQLLSDGMVAAEDAAATAAVFAALERAQRAAEEAASASGALEAAIKKAEDRGALRSLDSGDEDDDPPAEADRAERKR